MTVSFQNRLEQAEPVILSGGYLFEVERRGYLTRMLKSMVLRLHLSTSLVRQALATSSITQW